MDAFAKAKKNIKTISIVLFAISLTQKCFCTTTTCSDSSMSFLLGWGAVVSGGAGITWLANPCLFGAWITLKKNLKTSMFLSMFAFLIALGFLLFDNIKDNEGGVSHRIISYKPGYWLWVLSAFCMLAGTFFLMAKSNSMKMSLSKPEKRDYLH